MTDTVVVVASMVCATIIVLTGLVLMYLRDSAKRRESSACTGDPWHDMDPQARCDDHAKVDPLRVAEVALGRATLPEEKVVEQPIPFDPEHPPYWMIYNPRPGVERRSCHCHDDPLADGQEVLWWTLPDVPDPEIPDGRVLLFCRRAVPVEQT